MRRRHARFSRHGALVPGLALAAALGLVLGPAAAHAQRGIAPQSQQERAELSLSDWNPPARLICVMQELPYVLPRAESLLDVTALDADLTALPEAYVAPGAYVLVSVGYGATGRPDEFHVVESTLPNDELTDEIAQLVDQRLYRLGAGEPFGVRLRVLLGGPSVPGRSIVVDVGRREECYPRWAEAPAIGSLDEDPGVDHAVQVAVANRGAVRVFMSDEGEVDDAYALNSLASTSLVREVVSTTRRNGPAESALLDRRPMGFWFTVYTAEQPVRSIATHTVFYPTTFFVGVHYGLGYHRYYSGRPSRYFDPYIGLYCPAVFYGSYYGCDPYYNNFGRVGYSRYYRGFAWAGLGWYGTVRVPRYPSYPGGYYYPRPPRRPPPGVVIPPVHVPPVRPGVIDRSVILAGRPVREAGARGPRTVPFRSAPDAGDVSNGIRVRQPIARDGATGFVRRPGAGEVPAPRPERARPTAPVVRTDVGTARPAETSPRSRPTAPRAIRGERESQTPTPVRVERSRPANTGPANAARPTERPTVQRPVSRPDATAPRTQSPRPGAVSRPSTERPIRPATERPAAPSSRPAASERTRIQAPAATQRPQSQAPASRPAATERTRNQTSAPRPAATERTRTQTSAPRPAATQRPQTQAPVSRSRPAATQRPQSQAPPSRPAATQRPQSQPSAPRPAASRPAAPARTVRPSTPPPTRQSRPSVRSAPASRSGGAAVRPSSGPPGHS